jgi:hypothetical protein
MRYAWLKKCFDDGNCYQVQSLLKKERESQQQVVDAGAGGKDRRVVPGERGERMTREDLLAGDVGA